MRHRSIVIPLAAVAVLVLVALGGLWVYDGSRGQAIAKGIRVGGVDVGGMSATKARAKLRAEYLGRLRRPVLVHHGTITWVLRPELAKVSANIDAMVDEAVARSDRGGMLGRSWRRLTGGAIHADLRPQVRYDDTAVVNLLDAIRKRVDRAPIDATLKFTGASFDKQPARDGLEVDAHTLHLQMRRALVSPTASRALVARTHHVAPKVTTQDLGKTYGTLLIVDRNTFTLRLYKDLHEVKSYAIAVGMQGLETPAGLYHIQNKQVNPSWQVPNSAWAGKLAGKLIPPGPDDPIKARWLGIFAGAGIHGIDPSEYGSIGHAASHGCVRMRIPDVIDLYPRVPVGAPIYIA